MAAEIPNDDQVHERIVTSETGWAMLEQKI